MKRSRWLANAKPATLRASRGKRGGSDEERRSAGASRKLRRRARRGGAGKDWSETGQALNRRDQASSGGRRRHGVAKRLAQRAIVRAVMMDGRFAGVVLARVVEAENEPRFRSASDLRQFSKRRRRWGRHGDGSREKRQPLGHQNGGRNAGNSAPPSQWPGQKPQYVRNLWQQRVLSAQRYSSFSIRRNFAFSRRRPARQNRAARA